MTEQARAGELPDLEECQRRAREEDQKTIAAAWKTIAETYALLAEADRILALRYGGRL